MKKLNLNKKGFTLIELLAVIVILAIIMVVTIPTVLSSMNNARTNQLQNAADSVAEWFTKEYELAAMGDYMGGADPAFNTFVLPLKKDASNADIGTYNDLNGTGSTNAKYLTEAVVTAAGISNAKNNIVTSASAPTTGTNTTDSYVYYNTANNKMCVVLFAKRGGSFYVNTSGGNNKVCSSGCNNDCPTS